MRVIQLLALFVIIGFAMGDSRHLLHRHRLQLRVGGNKCGASACSQFKPHCCQNSAKAQQCFKNTCDKEKMYPTSVSANDYVAPVVQAPKAPSTHACGDLCAKNDEPNKRYGVEIEMKKWQLPVGGIASSGKLSSCPAGTYDKITAKGGAFFSDWYKEKGFKAIYTGKGTWAQWNIHLDGGGRIIEMVTKPGSSAETGAALLLFSNALNAANFGQAQLQALLFDEANFTPVHTDDDSKMIYCFIKNQLQYAAGASENFAGVIAPKAAQITTSFTLEEMKAKAGVFSHFGSPADDEGVKTFLMKTEFTGAEKPKDMLMKHAAEQLMAQVPDTVPNPFNFDHKLEPAFKMHSQANKLAKIMTRGGHNAYMVEFRGESKVGVENKIYELFRDKNTNAKDFEDAVKMV